MKTIKKKYTPPVREMISSGKIKSRLQPIIALKSRSIIGFEALASVESDGEIISPLDLFAEARNEGVLLDLDRECRTAALHEFCRTFPGINAFLFINIESSIIDMGVVGSNFLINQCECAGVSPKQIVLEIVETGVQNEELLREFVETHRARGFTIAIDDVGEGYSNLNRIALLKPDIIKCDRALACGLNQDYMKQRIVASLAGLSRNIGSLFLLEGVETEEEAITAFRLGTDLYQGYFFARPGDTSPEAMQAHAGKITVVAEKARENCIGLLNHRTEIIDRCFSDMEGIVSALENHRDTEFDELLSGFRGKIAQCECVYILNANGIQISETTLIADAPLISRFQTIFMPARKGSDHSVKDYFYFSANAKRRYVTDTYISFASGNPCFTITLPFVCQYDLHQYYLCADFREIMG